MSWPLEEGHQVEEPSERDLGVSCMCVGGVYPVNPFPLFSFSLPQAFLLPSALGAFSCCVPSEALALLFVVPSSLINATSLL